MKRGLKVVSITIGSLVALVVVGVCLVCWLIFTPARLTGIVNRVAKKYLTCEVSVGEIDLALFNTFPNVSLKLSDVTLINPMDGAISDTVATIQYGLAVLDVGALMNNGTVILQRLQLDGGCANLYTNVDGVANYMVFPIDTLTEEPDDTIAFDIPNTDIKEIDIRNVRVDYFDASTGQKATIDGLSALINGRMQDKQLQAVLNTSLRKVSIGVEGEREMNVCVEDIVLGVNGGIHDNEIKADMTVEVGFANMLMADMEARMEQAKWVLDGVGIDGQWIGTTILTTKPVEVKMEGGNPMNVILPNLMLEAEAKYQGNDIVLNPKLTLSNLTVDFEEERILDKANIQIQAALLSDTLISHIVLTEGLLALNEQEITLCGQVNMPDTSTLKADIDFETNQWDITRLLAMVPVGYQNLLEGIDVNGEMVLKGRGNALLVGNETHIGDVAATLSLENIDFSYNDSMAIESPKTIVNMVYNGKSDYMKGYMESDAFHMSMNGLADAQLHEMKGELAVKQAMRIADGHVNAKAHVFINQAAAAMDTLGLYTQGVSMDIIMDEDEDNPRFETVLHMDTIHTTMGTLLTASTGKLNTEVQATYDESADNLLLQWNPHLSFDAHAIDVASPMLTVPMVIPHIQFNYAEGRFTINDSHILLGNSNFGLRGDVHNIDSFMDKTGLLKAELDFSSSYTDVTQLMELVSGLGNTDTTEVANEVAEADVATEDDPFMVPLGVDVRLNTDIRTANVNGFNFDDIGGYVAVKDGVLVLEEMGFSSDAARMQLTAMYKSPRKNHLYVGFDFHLLDIEIEELIHMIPDVDSIIPMLSVFDGEAEFHFAAETYLKSNYDIKMSTLRAAGAIEGKDLVVMDNETFEQISKYLLFEKDTKNVVDSVSVELTVFKDEVDLYPFLISMDDYKAVIGGRHNINENLDFDYHISLTSPLRLGLDINGSLEDMKFRPVACKYAHMYNPKKQNVVQARTLQLKKIISDSLKDNVKPQAQ